VAQLRANHLLSATQCEPVMDLITKSYPSIAKAAQIVSCDTVLRAVVKGATVHEFYFPKGFIYFFFAKRFKFGCRLVMEIGPIRNRNQLVRTIFCCCFGKINEPFVLAPPYLFSDWKSVKVVFFRQMGSSALSPEQHNKNRTTHARYTTRLLCCGPGKWCQHLWNTDQSHRLLPDATKGHQGASTSGGMHTHTHTHTPPFQ